MAFKLTYTDGQADDYDDNTKWEVESGVLKLGKESGDWTVFVSPSHWATIELAQQQEEKPDKKKDEDKRDKGQGKEEDQAKDQDADESEESADEDRAEAS